MLRNFHILANLRILCFMRKNMGILMCSKSERLRSFLQPLNRWWTLEKLFCYTFNIQGGIMDKQLLKLLKQKRKNAYADPQSILRKYDEFLEKKRGVSFF